MIASPVQRFLSLVQRFLSLYASTYLHRGPDAFSIHGLMISRHKLLDAAARVYAEAGFRGATTRRIAEEAGVNEVTIFRLFGSKADLLSEAIHRAAPEESGLPLPDKPVDPERELTLWATKQLDFLRANRSLIRKSLAEVEELPEMGVSACQGCLHSFDHVGRYVQRLTKLWKFPPDIDASAATAMLMGALFADAIGREVMPALYRTPVRAAAGAYVRVFLRALGAPSATVTSPRRVRTRA